MFIPRDVGLWLIKWSRKRRACWMFLALISLSRSRSELIMGEKSVSVRNALVETMKFLCWTVITTPSREWSWIVITVNTYHSALPSLQIFSFSHDSTVFFWVVLEIRRPGWQGMDFWWPTLLELPPSEFFSELFTTVVFFKSGVSCSLGENSITVNDWSFIQFMNWRMLLRRISCLLSLTSIHLPGFQGPFLPRLSNQSEFYQKSW